MNKSNQWRYDVWANRQAETREFLARGAVPGDGIVEASLEEAVMEALGASPHPIWEAPHDAWHPDGLASSTDRDPLERSSPRRGRRLEIKALSDTSSTKQITVEVAQCDDVAFVLWQAKAKGSELEIIGDVWMIKEVATAFGTSRVGLTGIGVAQIMQTAPVVSRLPLLP